MESSVWVFNYLSLGFHRTDSGEKNDTSKTTKNHSFMSPSYMCVPTIRVSAHGEVQHGVAELVLSLLLQLLTQTLQGSLFLSDTNSSQLWSVSTVTQSV